MTEKRRYSPFLRRKRVCWQTAADTAVGFADSIGLSWPSLIECGPLSKSKSTHRPRQRKAPSRTLMINQRELERTFDCVYSQINKLTASQRQTELLSSVSEDHKNMILDHDNKKIWRKHTHEIWHLKGGGGGGIVCIFISVTSNIIVREKQKWPFLSLVFHAARFCSNSVQRPLRCFYCLYQGHCATSTIQHTCIINLFNYNVI